MKNKEILKKQIIYRSAHRGSKEMDILLGNFVKEHIDDSRVPLQDKLMTSSLRLSVKVSALSHQS